MTSHRSEFFRLIEKDSSLRFKSFNFSNNFTVVDELKKTSYKNVKTTVLGSRDQLCILPELESKSSSFKNHMCIKKNNKTARCVFNEMSKLEKEEFKEARVVDIEDLVRIGKTVGCCPFYASKELASNADVIFMPYNYLVDQSILKQLLSESKLDLQNAIIIFDEAHNILKTCEEVASVQITTLDIKDCIEEIEQVSKKLCIYKAIKV